MPYSQIPCLYPETSVASNSILYDGYYDGYMPKKAKELSNLEVRRLKHAIASSGKPYNAVYCCYAKYSFAGIAVSEILLWFEAAS